MLIDSYEKRLELLLEPMTKVDTDEIAIATLNRSSIYQLHRSFDAQDRIHDDLELMKVKHELQVFKLRE